MKKKPSKRYKKIKKESEGKKIDSIDDAIKYVKANCTAKFDESIDVSFNLNLKKKKEEVSLRTTVNLPHGNGKKIKVAVLCEESKIKEAKEAMNPFLKPPKNAKSRMIPKIMSTVFIPIKNNGYGKDSISL